MCTGLPLVVLLLSACSGAENWCVGGEGSFQKKKKKEREKMREVRKGEGNIRKGRETKGGKI